MRAKVLVLLMTLAAGCATGTTPITTESGARVPADRIEQRELTEPAPDRTVKVTVLRDSGAYGSACTHVIEVDGKDAFEIRAGEYQTVYLPAGEHELTLRVVKSMCPAHWASLRVVLRDKQERVFRIYSGLFKRPDLAEVGESGEEVASAEPSGCSEVTTPGFSLDIREVSRVPSSRGTQVTYRVASNGFPASASLPLWSQQGDSCAELW